MVWIYAKRKYLMRIIIFCFQCSRNAIQNFTTCLAFFFSLFHHTNRFFFFCTQLLCFRFFLKNQPKKTPAMKEKKKRRGIKHIQIYALKVFIYFHNNIMVICVAIYLLIHFQDKDLRRGGRGVWNKYNLVVISLQFGKKESGLTLGFADNFDRTAYLSRNKSVKLLDSVLLCKIEKLKDEWE